MISKEAKKDASDCLAEITKICRELSKRTGLKVTAVEIEWSEEENITNSTMDIEQ